MSLSHQEISALLALEKPREKFIPKPQVGPLRRYDFPMRCASKRCGVSTNYRLQGVPTCPLHALETMNEMLFSAGFKGIVNPTKTNPTPLPEGRIISATPIAYLNMGWSLGKFECIHGINLTSTCRMCEES